MKKLIPATFVMLFALSTSALNASTTEMLPVSPISNTITTNASTSSEVTITDSSDEVVSLNEDSTTRTDMQARDNAGIYISSGAALIIIVILLIILL